MEKSAEKEEDILLWLHVTPELSIQSKNVQKDYHDWYRTRQIDTSDEIEKEEVCFPCGPNQMEVDGGSAFHTDGSHLQKGQR